MRPLLALVILCLCSLSVAKDVTTDSYSDKLNTIEPKPSVRLDPYIRKALLKALSELEESDNSTTGSDFTYGTTGFESDSFTTGEDVPETQTEKEGIQIHSFIVNGQSAFANNNTNTPTIIDNNISILSTTAGNVESQVTATLPTSAPFPEIFQTRESGVNFQQTRSITNPSKSSTDNSATVKKPTFKPLISTTTTSTTTTTTTTTPKPTHNEDGENIEEVDKRDVQVYQAPLVAAFTVHQDSQGLPKKVIPLYQQINNPNFIRPLPTNNLGSEIIQPQPIGQIIPSISVNQLPQSDFINQQLALQKQLEEKQRILEEQLRLLQLQQRQQEVLLRKQQYLLQQKEAQRQQILSNHSKFQAQSSVNNFQVQKNIPQNQFINHNVPVRPNNSQVSIQPSVPLEPITSTVANQQQLPNREAVDFLIHLHSQQPDQFPLQENHLPQGISNFLHPTAAPNFHQGINFNQVRTVSDPFSQQKQNHRVFRQDSGVGNFGINNQNFAYNTFSPIHTNRFFPSNTQNQYNVDAELKQLFVQNGLNGRNQEDLNIVSKVLSLNHGVSLNNNIVSNRLPFDSRRHVRPLI